MRTLVAIALVILAGCADDEPPTAVPPATTTTTADAGPTGCPAGERPLDDGACQPAGVRPEACGEGFEADGAQGCNAVLPAQPCGPGQMAIPGETECREVAPCGTGTWGDIPVDATTQYVDAGYAGTDSDGTEARPWTTIAGAMLAAEPGALIAIAAGSYPETVLVLGRSVRLWGRCPSLVEIVAPAISISGVDIRNGASDTEIHTLAITGDSIGIAASGAEHVVADRVWLHDLVRAGIAMEPTIGAVGIEVDDSLIENVREAGIYADQAELVVTRSVVRDTTAGKMGEGRGIHLQTHANKPPATATITACVVERNREMGIYVAASNAAIERTVVRDTLPNSFDEAGRGLDVLDIDTTGQRANVTVKSCAFERNQEIQIAAEASDLTIESTTVRDTAPIANDGSMGRGISIQDRSSRATFTLRESIVSRSLDGALVVLGSDATLESVVLRDAAGRASDKAFGRGLSVQFGNTAADRGNLTMRWSVVEGARDFAIAVLGSDAALEASAVRGTLGSAADGQLGDGVAVVKVQDASSATLTGMLVAHNARAGVSSFGSAVTLSDTKLECNPIQLDAEEFDDPSAGFENAGGVICGCDDTTVDCVALSSSLTPPTGLP